MKQQVSPIVAVAAVIGLLVVVGFVGMMVFGRNGGGPSKPPPEMLAKIEQQKQAMKHYTNTPGFSSAARPPAGAGQSAEQQRAMQEYFKNHPSGR